ncbi:LysR substrate-binding domain-containing protein [Ensifer sesbaniae]|uniref:LysR substrate-binding domain-containing protein n=1 Tax=Ensifer sesbaniae TaxID=1214071 RepID=UPI00156A677A|nr:LysR substrate-binding domain-containing protein [Ensifer sesbaniae]NRQ17440.1 Glycine cleavage system transcriptional activator [Ensifer sesbaniae]
MRRFLPSLSALHAFDASVRHLNFTRAAEDIGITQSGISRQIRNLESFLGLSLFERSGPRLILTESGASYYEEVSRLLGKLEEASIDAVRGRKTQGILKIGLPSTLMRRWGATVLTAFSSNHPQAWFEVYPCRHDLEFATSDLDFAILRGTGNWSGARSHLLFPEELVVVGSPKLLPAEGLPSDEALLDCPLIQNSARPSLWLHWLRGAGVSYNSRIYGPRLPTTDMIIECALQGMGLAVVPEIHVREEIADGRLRPAFRRYQPSGESFYLCYPESRIGSDGVRAFRDWFLTEFQRQRQFLPPAPDFLQR